MICRSCSSHSLLQAPSSAMALFILRSKVGCQALGSAGQLCSLAHMHAEYGKHQVQIQYSMPSALDMSHLTVTCRQVPAGSALRHYASAHQ